MSRDVSLLHPTVQAIREKFLAECNNKTNNLNIKTTDTFRSKEEQNAVDASATNAKYPRSYHNWGLAFDICVNDPKDLYNIKKLEKAGQIGKKYGMFWGGDFKSFKDRPHFEYRGFGVINTLLERYKNPEAFIKTWNTSQSTATLPTLRRGDKGSYVVDMQEKLIAAGITRAEVNGVAKKVVADGVFGAISEAAVKRFQKVKGLTQDGICGKNTWKALG